MHSNKLDTNGSATATAQLISSLNAPIACRSGFIYDKLKKYNSTVHLVTTKVQSI
uniref:Uncharacterized protein n=1 Tax=Arundo donax TaxID=35708 RepID=A0A0A9HBH7_ARUDO